MSVADSFPITTAAMKRLWRNIHIWWAHYHIFVAIEHFEKSGSETDADLLRMVFVASPAVNSGEKRR